VSTARKPIGFATYNGDVTSVTAEGAKGPNYVGELMFPVTAEYDAATDKTRVGFSLVPDLAAEADRAADRVRQVRQTVEFFEALRSVR